MRATISVTPTFYLSYLYVARCQFKLYLLNLKKQELHQDLIHEKELDVTQH